MRVLEVIVGVYILLFFLILILLGISSIIKYFYSKSSNANENTCYLLNKICDILGTIIAWMFWIVIAFFALAIVIALVDAGWNMIIGNTK